MQTFTLEEGNIPQQITPEIPPKPLTSSIIPPRHLEQPSPLPSEVHTTPTQSESIKIPDVNKTIPAMKSQPLPVVALPTQTNSPILPKTSIPAKTTPFLQKFSQELKDPRIKELYGKDFDNYSESQKEFIKNNISAIGSVTQKHLRYPQLAGEMGLEGKNAIEFDLHPSGDITGLRLLKPSGYSLLDKNSIKTIEVAYKDYPKPSEITHIRIYVDYKIFNY